MKKFIASSSGVVVTITKPKQDEMKGKHGDSDIDRHETNTTTKKTASNRRNSIDAEKWNHQYVLKIGT